MINYFFISTVPLTCLYHYLEIQYVIMHSFIMLYLFSLSFCTIKKVFCLLFILLPKRLGHGPGMPSFGTAFGIQSLPQLSDPSAQPWARMFLSRRTGTPIARHRLDSLDPSLTVSTYVVVCQTFERSGQWTDIGGFSSSQCQSSRFFALLSMSPHVQTWLCHILRT